MDTSKNTKSHVFPRVLKKELAQATSAQRMHITDSDGHHYLDACGGAVVVNVGHGRKEIAQAVYEQILACDYPHPTMFANPTVEALAAKLGKHAPPGIDRFYFHSSGSEANEAALKLARTIHLEQGRESRMQVISRWKSYHGLTLGSLSAMGRKAFRRPYMPMLLDVLHIPPPFCFRCPFDLHFPSCDLQCARALEDTILNLGSETVSAFLAETVSGATLASSPPPPGYWKTIREICDRHGVLLILDEVMCGLGRTGKWFASEHYGVPPDIVTLGKGMGGGAVALAALGVQKRHYDAICNGSGSFIHGGTYSHHPVACAAGLATLNILEQEHLVERVNTMGEFLGECLKKEFSKHPVIGDIRGIGLMWGIEFVENRKTLKPFPRSQQVTETLWQHLYEKGILTYKSTGFAGNDGDALMIAPPFIVEKNEIGQIVQGLKDTLADIFKYH